jgi:predicted phage tail protein
MKEIRLYGHLARRFGRVHRFDVRTPAEAVRALRANFPDFAAAVMGFAGKGYRVVCGVERAGLSADALAHPTGEAIIKIVPVISGAGRGLGQIIVGAALIGFGVMTGGAGLSLSAAWAAGGMQVAGMLAANIGLSMVLGGVAQMLSPSPKTNGTPDRPENKPSFVFDGPVNTIAQGNAVPVLYGQLWVGSQVVSAGLSVEEYTV